MDWIGEWKIKKVLGQNVHIIIYHAFTWDGFGLLHQCCFGLVSIIEKRLVKQIGFVVTVWNQPKKNKFVLFYQSNLITVSIWFCRKHPSQPLKFIPFLFCYFSLIFIWFLYFIMNVKFDRLFKEKALKKIIQLNEWGVDVKKIYLIVKRHMS